jgi:hypothetical protein
MFTIDVSIGGDRGRGCLDGDRSRDETCGVANAVVALGVVLFPTILAMTVIRLFRLRRRFLARRRRGPAPVGPPIERIAADLRRLYQQRTMLAGHSPSPGRGLRTKALTAAYVDVLTSACRALDVARPEPNASGVVTDQEIERVEEHLRRHGLDVAAPGSG